MSGNKNWAERKDIGRDRVIKVQQHNELVNNNKLEIHRGNFFNWDLDVVGMDRVLQAFCSAETVEHSYPIDIDMEDDGKQIFTLTNFWYMTFLDWRNLKQIQMKRKLVMLCRNIGHALSNKRFIRVKCG